MNPPLPPTEQIPLNSRLYTGATEIPPYKQGDPFWDAIHDPALRMANNIALIETARYRDPSHLTDAECRVQLTKCFVYANNMEFARTFMEMQKEKKDPTPSPGSDGKYFGK